MKYAAAYIRVSDERQDEYSPDSQLKLIKEYAVRNEYDIPEECVFYDDGISGRSTKNRKSFKEMIAFATSKAHPVEAIIVWKFSRFMRNQEESIIYKAMLKRHNVSVISVSESVGDSAFAPLIERNIEFFDEYYSDRLSQEVKRGMKEKASRGEPLCAAPFGYKLENKCYYPDENADYIRYIFKAYINGMGLRQIARYLQSQGVRTKRGNLPDNRFVEYIICNPVYIGKIRWSTNGRASSNRYKNLEDVMIVDGNHEAIIDMETWEKAQEINQSMKLKYGKYQRREQPIEWMLKGLLRCDCSGATLVHQSTKEPAVQCHNYARGQCKQSHHLSLKKANEAVISGLESSIKNSSFNILPKTNKDIGFIDYDALIQKEKEKIERASAAYDAGFDTLEEYGRKKRAYKNNIDELLKQKEAAPKKEDKIINDDFISKVKSITKFIQSPDISEQAKNAALRTIIDHIDYEKSKNNLKIFFYI
ncbi:MAG: recombinase family protein [Eubacterium sp.]|nr:recombinase family protein [Eubacterium sp.]